MPHARNRRAQRPTGLAASLAAGRGRSSAEAAGASLPRPLHPALNSSECFKFVRVLAQQSRARTATAFRAARVSRAGTRSPSLTAIMI